MRFDINRLSKLAGIPAGSKQRSLNEASNRSYHEDTSVSGEAEYRFGKGQLSEMGEKYYEEGMNPDSMEEVEEDKEAYEGIHKDEAVYEIDEADLVSELRRLRVMSRINNVKKQQRRKQDLQEARLKKIIEEEVDNVFKDLENGKLDLNISGDWVYGKNKPRNSRRGRIARGFKSIGFK